MRIFAAYFFPLAAGILSVAPHLFADSLSYQVIAYPGSVSTTANDINNSDQIVGEYYNANGLEQGFLYSQGTYMSIEYPGAVSTQPLGINNQGVIVGTYETSLDQFGLTRTYGFIDSFGKFTSLSELPWDINDAGVIVGTIDNTQGFTLNGGAVSTFSNPLGLETFASGINDNGQVVGTYYYAPTKWTGYTKTGSDFATISIAPYGTEPMRVNDKGQIAGWYYAGDFGTHATGFLITDGRIASFDIPGASETLVNGLNENDQIVGGFQQGFGPMQGFIASVSTVPEPGSIFLMLLSFGAFGGVTTWKKRSRISNQPKCSTPRTHR